MSRTVYFCTICNDPNMYYLSLGGFHKHCSSFHGDSYACMPHSACRSNFTPYCGHCNEVFNNRASFIAHMNAKHLKHTSPVPSTSTAWYNTATPRILLPPPQRVSAPPPRISPTPHEEDTATTLAELSSSGDGEVHTPTPQTMNAHFATLLGCQICMHRDYGFVEQRSYETHCKAAHPDVGGLVPHTFSRDLNNTVCSSCGAKCKNFNDLQQHIEWNHLDHVPPPLQPVVPSVEGIRTYEAFDVLKNGSSSNGTVGNIFVVAATASQPTVPLVYGLESRLAAKVQSRQPETQPAVQPESSQPKSAPQKVAEPNQAMSEPAAAKPAEAPKKRKRMEELAGMYEDDDTPLLDALSGLTGRPLDKVLRDWGSIYEKGVETVGDLRCMPAKTVSKVYADAKPNYMLAAALGVLCEKEFL